MTKWASITPTLAKKEERKRKSTSSEVDAIKHCLENRKSFSKI
jgi:hypothetical protein